MTESAAPFARERFDLFQQAISDTFMPLALSVEDVGGFRGLVHSVSLGTVQLSDVHVVNDLVVRRTARLIERSAPDYLQVGVQLRGRCVVCQDGREAVLGPGDYAVYDTTRPYTLSFSGAYQRMFVIMFPSRLMRLSSQRITGLTARRMGSRRGLEASVSAFLTELGTRLDGVNHCGNLYLADAVLDVLAASFAEQLSYEDDGDTATGKSGLLLRIRTFIEERLADPALDVPTVAAAHHISVRYMQRLFENDGQTVCGWIRHRRIEHCRRDLADPHLAEVPVASIAARWGLVNAAHFSRRFKIAHGLAPTDYRAQILGQTVAQQLSSRIAE
jgi:AraC-like DNA-binding protein